jgi:hypothetical protein
MMKITHILFFFIASVMSSGCGNDSNQKATLTVKDTLKNEQKLIQEKNEELKKAKEEQKLLIQEKQKLAREEQERKTLELNIALGQKLNSNVFKNNSNGLLTYLKFESAEGYSGRLGALTLTNSNSTCKYVFSYNTNGGQIITTFVNSTCGAKSSDMTYTYDEASNTLYCLIKGQKFVFSPTSKAEIAVKQKPQPYFGSKTYGDPFITFSQLRTWNSLTLKIAEPSSGVQYQIIGYSFSIRSGSRYLDIPTTGNRLLSSAKDMINKAKVGDKVYFSNITIKGTDGRTERLGDLSFQITQ